VFVCVFFVIVLDKCVVICVLNSVVCVLRVFVLVHVQCMCAYGGCNNCCVSVCFQAILEYCIYFVRVCSVVLHSNVICLVSSLHISVGVCVCCYCVA